MDYCKEYQKRFDRYYDELKWLYCELYKNQDEAFEQLCGQMYRFYTERKTALKTMDRERAKDPQWYKGNRMVGMMMYVDAFAGDLNGVLKHLDYIEECGVNYLHLMPLLDSPKERRRIRGI